MTTSAGQRESTDYLINSHMLSHVLTGMDKSAEIPPLL